MHKLLRPVGELATKIESWWALGALVAGTGLFQWLGQQWDALASQGWAAVLMVAIISSSMVAIAASMIYFVAVRFRRRNEPVAAPRGIASDVNGATPVKPGDNDQKTSSRVDEEALNDLTIFVTDYVISLGCAQIDLQSAIIKHSYVNEALAELAVHAIMSNPNVRQFGESFNYLWGKFGSSPMQTVPLEELKQRILVMDKNYKSLMDQADRLAAGAGWKVRSHQAIAPLWAKQRNFHNDLVKAYRKIKRDRRFAPELYRPGINGPWTQEISTHRT